MSPLTPVPIDDEPELAPESESEFNLAEYLGMLRRHWKLAAVCCALRICSSMPERTSMYVSIAGPARA